MIKALDRRAITSVLVALVVGLVAFFVVVAACAVAE